MLTLEFGPPHLEIREPITANASASADVRAHLARRHVVPVGEWHLWVYCCHWRLLVRGDRVADCEDADDTLIEAAREIDGQKLVGVVVNQPRGTSCFQFDLGACLETWPYEDGSDDEEQWMLYTPQGQVLSFLADGRQVWEGASRRMTE